MVTSRAIFTYLTRYMHIDTVIFDMDGLLIDSEPLWNEATAEIFAHYNKVLTPEEYASTTGLRTSEFVAWWLKDRDIRDDELNGVTTSIIDLVTKKVKESGKALPGVPYVLDFFKQRNFKIGLATSSPLSLADAVIDILGIAPYLQTIASAEFLAFGKPHPQVYIDCAKQLDSSPLNCVCFEDSFNGMIAAKAARMKCVVVPAHHQLKELRWHAADLILSSLQNFNALHINLL